MKNWVNSIRFLGLALVLVLGYAIYSETFLSKQAKEIRALRNDIVDLEDEKQELEEELQSAKSDLGECITDNERMLRQLRWTELQRNELENEVDDLEWQKLIDD